MKEKLSLILKLVGVGAAIALIVLVILFFMKGCSPDNSEPTDTPPSAGTQDPANSSTPGPEQQGAADDPLESQAGTEDLEKVHGTYLNNKVLVYQVPTGGEISIGVQNDKTDGLYLNLQYSKASLELRGGQYVFEVFDPESAANFEYFDAPGAAPQSIVNEENANLVLCGHSYATAMSSVYENDTKYGVKWCRHGDDSPPGPAELFIRCYNPVSGTIVAVLRAGISMDEETETYELESLASNEVLDVTESDPLLQIDQATKDLAIDDVSMFLAGQDYFQNDDWWENALQNPIFLERIHAPSSTFNGLDGVKLRLRDLLNPDTETWRLSMTIDNRVVSFFLGSTAQVYNGEDEIVDGNPVVLATFGCSWTKWNDTEMTDPF